MMIPVRCFSCGQIIADKWEEYDKRVNKEKEEAAKVLDELGLKRYCCRRMLLSHVDLIDEVTSYGRK
ncbi:MAG: DNA-directed RNA polymerase subunit N [Candidatus Micrarchaeota archaeon]|nr:DNA-directed RNA polymerase subunit N [Candidatus Micrarchaeota archaeon]MDE1804366.1 DNA-directed RNA polymerase subunit N [Candidatus Micrarchaeota archaeon]MDE1846610.1 DNA-directed RNA polymerase subunit N [Candidatus Micrarchaeota archaeon]